MGAGFAPQFGRVLATEVSKPSVEAANEQPRSQCAIDNVTMVCMSSDEISDAYTGGREYRRMDGVDLASYNFTTLFLDPPRSGLDAGTLQLASGFENILYISCNPLTLQANVAALQATHRHRRGGGVRLASPTPTTWSALPLTRR